MVRLIYAFYTARLILFLAPKTWFPNTIVHASSTDLNKLNIPGSHVLLSSTVSVKLCESVSFRID